MKLTDEVINDIRDSANIVDVIKHYMNLEKKGRSYVGLCPFHDDHSPSMSVSEDKQIYKCFVCGNGGNVFTFVQNFKKVSFPEAVKEVSEIIGKPIEIDLGPKKVSKNQKYYDLLNKMITYCTYLLSASKAGQEAITYLYKRGLTDKDIEYFQIGYNPENNVIYQYLKKNNEKDEDMIKAGVCRMLDSGMADVFYKRIIFPIHDKDGNPIAFTARDFKGESNAKYINSNENIIYTKGDNLYNYHRAKPSCRQLGYVLICEGVMDVIAYYRAGKENVVATLGTACTKKQIELIKSLSDRVVLSYDGDNAGQLANIKVGEQLLEAGLQVQVIDNDTKLDPDEIINQFSKNALRDIETKKISYIEYAMKYYKNRYNLDNYEDRKAMTITVSKLIDKLADEYDRDNYANELYEITRIKRRETANKKKVEYNNKLADVNYSIDGLTKAEYVILNQMAISRKAYDIYQDKLGFLLDENNFKLAMLIIDDYRKNNKCSLGRIFGQTDDENIKNLINNLDNVDLNHDEYDEESLMGAIARVKKEVMLKKIADLKEKITINMTVDPKKAQELMIEYEKMIKDLGGNNGEEGN